VSQLISDVADASLPGAAPAQSFCHAEDLDLGVLLPAVYDVWWDDIVQVFFADPDHQSRYAIRVVPNGDHPCSDASTLILPPVMLAGEPFQISRTKFEFGVVPFSLKVSVAGNVITVDEQVAAGGYLPEFPHDCYLATAKIDGLPAGKYTLKWLETTVSPSRVETTSATLTVTPPTQRRRAAHH
jgi:hypothetical protein